MLHELVGKKVEALSSGLSATIVKGELFHNDSEGVYGVKVECEDGIRHVPVLRHSIKLLPKKSEAKVTEFNEQEMVILKQMGEYIPVWVIHNFFQHCLGILEDHEKAVTFLTKLGMTVKIEKEIWQDDEE